MKFVDFVDWVKKKTQSSHKLREQHWMSIIQQCNRESKQEGITKLECMEINGINYHSFYRWQHKLRNNIASELLIAQAQMSVPAVVESSVPQFAEVVPPTSCSASVTPSKTVLKCKNIITYENHYRWVVCPFSNFFHMLPI